MQEAKPVSASGFRGDINGLRAWAVVAVVLYHFGVPGFGGGFVGVDVFFVISGLLMTGIVLRSLEQQRFSVWDFYLARGRRIIPALLALCVALLAMGWFFLPVSDYKQLGNHVATSAGFVSNVKYWLEAGYFDASSHEKWLLHTWSLAVEWQFYLLLPLILMVIWRLKPGRQTALAAVVVGLVISLALCLVLTPNKPTGTFFLLPTRAWEMLAGGLLFFAADAWRPSGRSAQALEALGLLSIAFCVVVFTSEMAWPGWRAILPVAGGVLVLLAARQDSLWTGNFTAQWLGTRSYSIYLWHWPLVVGLEYAGLQFSGLHIAAGLLATLLLGHLSYRWIETPARVMLSKGSSRSTTIALGCATALVAGAGISVFLSHGVYGRMSSAIDTVSAESENSNPRKLFCHLSHGVASPSCEYGSGSLSAIVLGDSHGDAVMTAVAASLPNNVESKVMQWTYSACPTILGVRDTFPSDKRCNDFLNWSVNRLESVPSQIPLVIVNRHAQYLFGKNETSSQESTPWVYFSKKYDTSEPAFQSEYSQRLISTTCLLAKTHPVYLVRPIPEVGVNVPNTSRRMVFGDTKQVGISLADYRHRNALVWAAQDAAKEKCGVKILDPLPYLCPDGYCSGFRDGRPLYYDDNHLSEFGNKLLVPLFASVFGQSAEPITK